MSNYWIFVIKDQEDKSGTDIFKKLMEIKMWGLGERTPNRKRLEKNDSVVFYQAGVNAQQFLGFANLDSDVLKPSDVSKEDLESVAEVFNADYLIKLKDIITWPEPKMIGTILDKLEFIQNKEYWGTYFQGGVRAISEQDFNVIISPITVITQQLKIDGSYVNEIEFGLEKHLEDFIINNWDIIDFGMKLKLYKDSDGNSGQQYPTSIGYIDILAMDSDGKFVVIELKKGQESDKVVGQIARYMGWVKKNLSDGRDVNGLIITKDHDEKLMYAVSAMPNVKIKNYKVSFTLLDKM